MGCNKFGFSDSAIPDPGLFSVPFFSFHFSVLLHLIIMNCNSNPSSVSNSSRADVVHIEGKRILCTADVRGCISQLNQLATEANADFIIHTGDFGFYEQSSLERISDRTLKHLIQYSTMLPAAMRTRLSNTPIDQVRQTVEQSAEPMLSEFPSFLSGEKRLNVPVYTVWGACEDVAVLEKFRNKEYQIPNLFILDEATTYLLDIGGVSLRLFGLGGAVIQHKLFDNGEGGDTIAGGAGTMWTTTLQIGELVETANKVFDASETRILVTHASSGREGLLAQLALTLRADFTISAGLHFRYGISYNEFSCQPDQEHYYERLLRAQDEFLQLWDSIKEQVESYVDEHQAVLLQNALSVVKRLPASATENGSYSEREELAFKNMWNFNLPDAAFGWLVLDIKDGRVSSELKSQGFNFSYRRSVPASNHSPALSSTAVSQSQPEKPNQYNNSHQFAGDTTQAPSDNSSQFNEGNWRDPPKDEHHRNSKRQSSLRSPYVAYVGGLHNSTVTEEDIRNFFGSETITGVKFPLDYNTQLPKGHCYVDFIDPVALENALAQNGELLKDNRLIINKPNPQYGDSRYRGSRNGRGRSYRGSRGN
ncbi:uncharacterized protein BYT42DRAFT_579167 [Radiomyces spectabilis]|uniref:uncharacterized protein n=1 Tax=Radiomyces spectabilis TaxID=64574 RepID=UPI00221EFB7C|nr:uncharacterized protein BYT42DRAFT_579167 [Radiomyces spectabilis]KAI8373093.1 hypothetical protein BYT42DRAFT_579167 [Radiomyces spectabilis]